MVQPRIVERTLDLGSWVNVDLDGRKSLVECPRFGGCPWPCTVQEFYQWLSEGMDTIMAVLEIAKLL